MEDHTELVRLARALPGEDAVEQNKKLKLFISYSHEDNNSDNFYIEQFKKQITPLKDNGLIEVGLTRLASTNRTQHNFNIRLVQTRFEEIKLCKSKSVP